jgi:hypothetical protein
MWTERGARVGLIAAAQLVEMREAEAAAALLEPLLAQRLPTPSSQPALRSAIARIYLQGGLLSRARAHFTVIEQDGDVPVEAKTFNSALLSAAEGEWETCQTLLDTLRADEGEDHTGWRPGVGPPPGAQKKGGGAPASPPSRRRITWRLRFLRKVGSARRSACLRKSAPRVPQASRVRNRSFSTYVRCAACSLVQLLTRRSYSVRATERNGRREEAGPARPCGQVERRRPTGGVFEDARELRGGCSEMYFHDAHSLYICQCAPAAFVSNDPCCVS